MKLTKEQTHKKIGSKCFREGMRTRQALGRAGPYSSKIECILHVWVGVFRCG